MTNYQLQVGSTTFDVAETTRDMQIKFKDDVASEIQMWRIRSYFLKGDHIRADAPWCVIIPLEPPSPGVKTFEDEPFGDTGLTVNEALRVLDVLASQQSTPPDNIVKGSLTNPIIPKGIGATLIAAKSELEKANLNLAEVEARALAANEQLAQSHAVMQAAEEEFAGRQAQVKTLMAELDAQLANSTARIKELDDEIKAKGDTLEVLNASIITKSTESGALAVQIAEQKKKLVLVTKE